MAQRIEHDVLGSVKVPADAYYGSETQRALDNFNISDRKPQKELIDALAIIKIAAANANMKAGKLDKRKGSAIVRASKEVLDGKFASEFKIDLFQAGAGTSTHMNVNEVITNRAIELLHGRKGNYKIIHPNDDVNMSQSTNDVFHSAMHMSAYIMLEDRLVPSLERLEISLKKKSSEFSKTFKVGRTHLQDAVPMTLGQEFSAHASAMHEEIVRIGVAKKELCFLPIGGTAIGTGINAPKGYAKNCIAEINKLTGRSFKECNNKFYEIQDQSTSSSVSGALRNVAIVVSKLCNDLRLLSSGPSTGFNDIVLPAVLPGSSIMPGKVNPSIPEMANMVCFEVMGNDLVVANAALGGQLQLNVFMPIIAYKLLYSIEILSNAIEALTSRCINGIKANEKLLASRLEHDISIATALTPYIGYANAAEIARLSYRTGKSVKDICIEKKVLDRKTLDRVLDPKGMAFSRK